MDDELFPEQSGASDDIELDVTYDDVDEIIGIAARQKQQAAERLDRSDLQEVADDLGIASEHVDTALEELERRRKEEVRREKRRRELKVKAGIGAGAVAGLVVVVGAFDVAQLRGDLNDARQQRSQVANVVDRLEQTEEYFADRDDDEARAPELQGALNRVSVETRRYDEAATDYNRRASGMRAGLWTTLFGLPAELPLSDEIDDW